MPDKQTLTIAPAPPVRTISTTDARARLQDIIGTIVDARDTLSKSNRRIGSSNCRSRT
jgi:hypothetical protein